MTSSQYGCEFASSYISSQLQGSVLFGDCINFQGRSEAHQVSRGGVSDVKCSSFYKNNDFFTQILPENVKICSILDFS
jgi:hypothetical protein